MPKLHQKKCCLLVLVCRTGHTQEESKSRTTSPDNMQSRTDHSTGIVLSLMTTRAQSAGPAAAAAAISRSQTDSVGFSSFPHDLGHDVDEMIEEEDEDGDSVVDNVADSLGVLKVDTDNGKSIYLGNSHWHLVLAEVGFILLPLLHSPEDVSLFMGSFQNQVRCNVLREASIVSGSEVDLRSSASTKLWCRGRMTGKSHY